MLIIRYELDGNQVIKVGDATIKIEKKGETHVKVAIDAPKEILISKEDTAS